MISTDIIIVGGGCVGLALATALGQQNIKCVVIDAQNNEVELSDSPELRVSAISAASQSFLTNLNAWQHIEQLRLQPYSGMSVWEKDSFGKISFNAEDINQPRLGHIIENNVIRKALLTQLAQHESVQLIFEKQCKQINHGEREVMVNLDDGTPVIGKLIVAADGANSFVRSQAKIPMTFWDYDHTAIVATVETTLPHENTARQAFLPTGPLAFLPLFESDASTDQTSQDKTPEENQRKAQTQCSIVWSTSHDHAQSLLNMEESEFNKALTVAFDNRLGLCKVKSKRVGFPLKMRYCRDWVTKRTVLIGDAAHTIHPLAGLGMNLGLMDAAALAETLIELNEAQKDMGEQSNLRSFERWRKAEAQTLIAAMEGLKRLFSGDNPLLKAIRSTGLALANNISPAKHQVIKHAMGLAGDLPKMAKTEQNTHENSA